MSRLSKESQSVRRRRNSGVHAAAAPAAAAAATPFDRTSTQQPPKPRLTIWGSLTASGWFGRSAAASAAATAPPAITVSPASERNTTPVGLSAELHPLSGSPAPAQPTPPPPGGQHHGAARARKTKAPPPSLQLTLAGIVLGYDNSGTHGSGTPGSGTPGSADSQPLRLVDSYLPPPSVASPCREPATPESLEESSLPQPLSQLLSAQEEISLGDVSCLEGGVRGAAAGGVLTKIRIQDPESYSLQQPPPVTVPVTANGAVDPGSLLAALASFMGSGTMSDMWSESDDDEQEEEGEGGGSGLDMARKSFENPVGGAFMIDLAKPARWGLVARMGSREDQCLVECAGVVE